MTEANYEVPQQPAAMPEAQNVRDDRASSMRPRPVNYDWSQLPVHWYKDDPQMTHTINVLNLLLPEGETWFVRVFAECIPYLTEDRELRRDIRGFMGQEANHANAHQELLDYLDAHDIPTEEYTNAIAYILRVVLGQDPMGREIKNPWLKRKWNTTRLAAVAALEHVTAYLGAWTLNAERFDEEGVDQVMIDLLRWHGAEEVEHQSVALDILKNVSPKYHHVWRTGIFAIAFPALFIAWVQGVRYLMAKDQRLDHGPTWAKWFEAGRAEYLPTVLGLMKTVPNLMNPDYDPRVSEAANMKKAVAQIAKSHGAHMV